MHPLQLEREGEGGVKISEKILLGGGGSEISILVVVGGVGGGRVS